MSDSVTSVRLVARNSSTSSPIRRGQRDRLPSARGGTMPIIRM
ncbi:MAG TPA: hypothetical protein VFD94_06720 [Jatrophihabitans sp.]|nr:hypothetical protein [Jatrophihabitans sp.]